MRPYRRFAYLFLPFALVSALAASAVFAAPSTTSISMPSGNDVIKAVMTFIFGDCASLQVNCIPDEWMTYGGFMQYIIFPFIAVFVVMYGILSEIRIFHEVKVKAVLALVMAFVGGYYALSSMRWFLVVNSTWGTIGFGILMVIGILLWIMRGLMENVAGISKPYYALTGKHLTESMKRSVKISQLEKQLEFTRAAAIKETDPAIKQQLLQRLDQIQKDMDKELGI